MSAIVKQLRDHLTANFFAPLLEDNGGALKSIVSTAIRVDTHEDALEVLRRYQERREVGIVSLTNAVAMPRAFQAADGAKPDLDLKGQFITIFSDESTDVEENTADEVTLDRFLNLCEQKFLFGGSQTKTDDYGTAYEIHQLYLDQIQRAYINGALIRIYSFTLPIRGADMVATRVDSSGYGPWIPAADYLGTDLDAGRSNMPGIFYDAALRFFGANSAQVPKGTYTGSKYGRIVATITFSSSGTPPYLTMSFVFTPYDGTAPETETANFVGGTASVTFSTGGGFTIDVWLQQPEGEVEYDASGVVGRSYSIECWPV